MPDSFYQRFEVSSKIKKRISGCSQNGHILQTKQKQKKGIIPVETGLHEKNLSCIQKHMPARAGGWGSV